MEVFDAVRTVLAVRAYQTKQVPEPLIRKIVEAGRFSASSMNKQPWHFIVVQEPATLRELGALAKTGPYVAGAPLAVAVAIEDTQFAVSDASRAIQNMMLTAWSEGVGSNWAGWYGLDEVAKLLGVPPTHQVLALIPFGYPDAKLGRGKKQRKPLGEVASRERYGLPFS